MLAFIAFPETSDIPETKRKNQLFERKASRGDTNLDAVTMRRSQERCQSTLSGWIVEWSAARTRLNLKELL
jgi:hypothetical protein